MTSSRDFITPVNDPPHNRMLSVWDRYQQDAEFRQLVDTLTAILFRAEYTPSELRQAVILASMQYDEHRLSRMPIMIMPDGPVGHLRAMEEWLKAETMQVQP